MFKITLLTPKEELYVGFAEEVILPTEEGQLTVLDFHQPMLTRLTKGVISVDKRWLFSINDGIINTTGFELVGIVET